MTVQAFEPENESTDEELKEAIKLMHGLTFTKSRHCTDGHESWTSNVKDLDSFVKLIKRSRGFDNE